VPSFRQRERRARHKIKQQEEEEESRKKHSEGGGRKGKNDVKSKAGGGKTLIVHLEGNPKREKNDPRKTLSRKGKKKKSRFHVGQGVDVGQDVRIGGSCKTAGKGGEEKTSRYL